MIIIASTKLCGLLSREITLVYFSSAHEHIYLHEIKSNICNTNEWMNHTSGRLYQKQFCVKWVYQTISCVYYNANQVLQAWDEMHHLSVDFAIVDYCSGQQIKIYLYASSSADFLFLVWKYFLSIQVLTKNL